MELWSAALQVFDYLSEERIVVNSLMSGPNDHKSEQVGRWSGGWKLLISAKTATCRFIGAFTSVRFASRHAGCKGTSGRAGCREAVTGPSQRHSIPGGYHWVDMLIPEGSTPGPQSTQPHDAA
jgi:hypothetical protein